jgi:hypothetical protein
MSDDIQAIPTEYRGVRFKSRLEARFAEWLTEVAEAEWEYEPENFPGKQRYTPDFKIHELGLYVEIKPMAKVHELEIFKDDIHGGEPVRMRGGWWPITSARPWIAVDQEDRDHWHIIDYNDRFSREAVFCTPIRFELKRYEGLLFLRTFPKVVALRHLTIQDPEFLFE